MGYIVKTCEYCEERYKEFTKLLKEYNDLVKQNAKLLRKIDLLEMQLQDKKRT